MKTVKILTLLTFFCFTLFHGYAANNGSGGAAQQECIAGGPGATQCSHTTGGFFGLFTVTYEVSCGNGYYACCNSNGANCIPNTGGGRAGGSW